LDGISSKDSPGLSLSINLGQQMERAGAAARPESSQMQHTESKLLRLSYLNKQGRPQLAWASRQTELRQQQSWDS
jgi:hypothetical protein